MPKPTIKIELWPIGDERAIQLEYDVFLEAGYIEANDQHRVLQYDPYPHGEFLVALQEGEVVGSMRLIYASGASATLPSFSTLREFELYPETAQKIYEIPQENIVEIGTMAVRKQYRGTMIKSRMIKSFLLNSWKNSRRHVLASLDLNYFRSLHRMGMPCEQIGPKRDYMGSTTIPTYFDSKGVPILYRWPYYIFRARRMLS